MKILRRIGKYYTRIILKNIGVFIFIGLLSVLCGEYGWLPNGDIYAISQLVYQYILPTMIAYEAGQMLGEGNGGILAALATTGILLADPQMGIFGAMLAGPLGGFLWRMLDRILNKRMDFRFMMLWKNLSVAAAGSVLAAFLYYIVAPGLQIFTALLGRGMEFLIAHRLTVLLALVIEPAKVFFLNNVVHHAVLVPLGMQQVQEAGSSVLFLLEANPGPGFGVLLALYCAKRDRKNEYASSMVAHVIGGIHEVYFPMVLADLRLLVPLILGGMAGNICFQFLNAGLQGVVSPGSILVILLMAGRHGCVPVLAGVVASAATSFALGMAVLRRDGKTCRAEDDGREQSKVQACEVPGDAVCVVPGTIACEVPGTAVCEVPGTVAFETMEAIEKRGTMAGGEREKKKVKKIAFVCDGGVGSSAMGAALMRRMLAQNGMEEIQVKAYAADLVPEDVEFVVCQKDFFYLLPEQPSGRAVYVVDSLVQTEGWKEIIEELERRNG